MPATTYNLSTSSYQQAAWLVYINGLEIPVIGVDVTYQVWEVPTAQVHMVPHPIIQRIGMEDRLQVAIFFLDNHYNPSNPQFRLLGEFEVAGWGFSTSKNQRVLTLHCNNQLQIFKQMYFNQLSAYKTVQTKELVADKTNAVVNLMDGHTEFDDTTESSFTEVTKTKKRNIIRRPIDLVLHIFRGVLNPVYTKKPQKKQDPPAIPPPEEDTEIYSGFSKVQDSAPKDIPTGKNTRAATSVIGKNFFARWFKMTGFHTRWVALPLFEEEITAGGVFPIIKATGGYSALKSLSRHTGARGANAWQILLNVYSKMYMEICCVPAPPFASIKKGKGVIVGPTYTGKSDEFRGIPAYFVKPQCFFGLPPMCNVIFPSMLQKQEFQESYIDQPTRIKLAGTARTPRVIKALTAGTDPQFASLVKQLMRSGYPSVVHNRMQRYAKSPGSNEDNFLIFPEEMFKGPVIKHLNAPPWIRNLQKRIMNLAKPKKEEEKPSEDAPELDTFMDKMSIPDYESDDGKVASEGSKKSGNKPSAVAVDKNTYTISDLDPPDRTEETAKHVSQLRGMKRLMQKYAQYEFLRARYTHRSGSASLAWNPYVVPGFPCAILDGRATALDTYGYIQAVQHSLSAHSRGPQMSTNISISFQRTIQEARRDFIREPFASVRKIFQDVDLSNTFYHNTFFSKNPSINLLERPTVFEESKILEVKDIDTEEMGPTVEYEEIFSDYDSAMHRIARPGCTLKEYIEVFNQENFDKLIVNDYPSPRFSFYSLVKDPDRDSQYTGARYWDRIYKLKQGGGDYPGPLVTNIEEDAVDSPADEFIPVDDAHGDMPQTRYDWDTALERYRLIIRETIAPQE